MIGICIFIGFILLICGMALWSFHKHTHSVPPDKVLVVYGKTGPNSPKVYRPGHGKVIIWPILQDYAHLSLRPFCVEVERQSWTVAVAPDEPLLHTAVQRLLGLRQDEIEKHAVNLIREALHRGDDPAAALEGIGLILCDAETPGQPVHSQP